MLSVSGARCDVAPWALCKRVYKMYSSGCQSPRFQVTKRFLASAFGAVPAARNSFRDKSETLWGGLETLLHSKPDA